MWSCLSVMMNSLDDPAEFNLKVLSLFSVTDEQELDSYFYWFCGSPEPDHHCFKLLASTPGRLISITWTIHILKQSPKRDNSIVEFHRKWLREVSSAFLWSSAAWKGSKN